MRASAPPSSSAPPMYWKVPGSDKSDRDYIVENMKEVRQVSSQVRKAKSKERMEPMKVKFIPGLTKNPKYGHVESRISGLIRGTMRVGPDPETRLKTSDSPTGFEGKLGNGDLKPIWGASAAANARRIQSSPDLRKSVDTNPPVFRRKLAALKPHEESVYNWRFSEMGNYSPAFVEQEKETDPEKFTKFQNAKGIYFHRVEYLPCDGICADEPVFNGGNTGSGDSGSGRSSRGINTEETRIFSTLRPARSITNIDHDQHNNGHGEELEDSEFYTRLVPSTNYQSEIFPRRELIQSRDTHQISRINGDQHKENAVDPFVARIEKNMTSMKLNKFQNQGNAQSQTVQAPTLSNGTYGSTFSLSHRSYEGSGNSPHRVGEVPKYLKKRQQQWKEEEIAKKEAEKTAHIPPGHVEMSESERLETLIKLKNTYDSLVNELNRVPIRIDTIRVREYKQKLEQELTKLEQAMKLFSRPQVYIKIEQQ